MKIKTIDLSEDFRPFTSAVEPMWFKTTTFPDETPHFRLDENEEIEDDTIIIITTRIRNGNDLFLLAMVKDVLEQQRLTSGTFSVQLFIPYFPGARQDKRDSKHLDPLSSKIYAKFINDLNFDSVGIVDPHSPTIMALVDRSYEIPQEDIIPVLFDEMLDHMDIEAGKVVFISPDAGASHKSGNVVRRISKAKNYVFELIQGQKKRDPETGNLSGFNVLVHNGGLEGKHCVIIDDTCSNGGTFLGLAAKLKEKGAEKVFLITSHFDGGTKTEKVMDLVDGLDGYVTTNSIWKSDTWSLYDFSKFHEWEFNIPQLQQH